MAKKVEKKAIVRSRIDNAKTDEERTKMIRDVLASLDYAEETNKTAALDYFDRLSSGLVVTMVDGKIQYPSDEVRDEVLEILSPLQDDGTRLNEELQNPEDLSDPDKLVKGIRVIADAQIEAIMELGATKANLETTKRELERVTEEKNDLELAASLSTEPTEPSETSKKRKGKDIAIGVLSGALAVALGLGGAATADAIRHHDKLDDANKTIVVLNAEAEEKDKEIERLKGTDYYKQLQELNAELAEIAKFLEEKGYYIQQGESASDTIQKMYKQLVISYEAVKNRAEELSRLADGYKARNDAYYATMNTLEEKINAAFAAYQVEYIEYDDNGNEVGRKIAEVSDFPDDAGSDDQIVAALDALIETIPAYKAEIEKWKNDYTEKEAEAQEWEGLYNKKVEAYNAAVQKANDLQEQIDSIIAGAYQAAQTGSSDVTPTGGTPVSSDDPTEIPSGADVDDDSSEFGGGGRPGRR